jgi:hypothetical protein
MLWLDYAPLRLGAMTFWAWVNSHRFPGVNRYQESYEFTKPILYFNLGIEILMGVGLFLLARHWVRRSNPDAPFGGELHGLAAALFAWVNPALVLSAHCWPTWDIWVAAFFIWAV